jgi:hypothetical protein
MGHVGRGDRHVCTKSVAMLARIGIVRARIGQAQSEASKPGTIRGIQARHHPRHPSQAQSEAHLSIHMCPYLGLDCTPHRHTRGTSTPTRVAAPKTQTHRRAAVTPLGPCMRAPSPLHRCTRASAQPTSRTHVRARGCEAFGRTARARGRAPRPGACRRCSAGISAARRQGR